MRKTWDLAQKVTHGDIDDVDAFAAAQATVLPVSATELIVKQACKGRASCDFRITSDIRRTGQRD